MAVTGGKSSSFHTHKSSIFGASANLINAIVGAGIVGIPFAIQQAGLLTGMLLVVLVAFLAGKSLCMLIEAAACVRVNTYESLFEAAFGRAGFICISLSMAILAYGAMVTYLILVKDAFSMLLLQGEVEVTEKRMVLLVVSCLIIVPLSCQRDMAALSMTSRVNVVCDIFIVLLVVYNSPMSAQLQERDDGSVLHALKSSTVHPNTVFIGLGVLSFAFVCQHSAFMIASSLENIPKEWPQVTKYALRACAVLALTMGVAGYLGYRDDTQGNILNNLGMNLSSELARGLLGTTMIFVYPLESFVARHAVLALFFRRGPKHHADAEKDIWDFLNSTRKRVGLTALLYTLAVIPALFLDDLGKVLAVVGTIGGSCISYIGPGVAFLGGHGQAFLDLVGDTTKRKQKIDQHIWSRFLWYILFMPLWCGIASTGCSNITKYQQTVQSEKEIELAPVLAPSGYVVDSDDSMIFLVGNGNHSNGTQLNNNDRAQQHTSETASERDFWIAIGYILFGTVALVAGLFCILC